MCFINSIALDAPMDRRQNVQLELAQQALLNVQMNLLHKRLLNIYQNACTFTDLVQYVYLNAGLSTEPKIKQDLNFLATHFVMLRCYKLLVSSYVTLSFSSEMKTLYLLNNPSGLFT